MKMKNINIIFQSKNKFGLVKSASVLLLCLFSLGSCKNYLDVVPDNVPTIDNAFTLRNEAEKYLFTCYSFLPRDGDPTLNPGYMAGDEIWSNIEEREFISSGWRIARGSQNTDSPLMDMWNGSNQGGGGLYRAIRTCNIFLENVQDPSKVSDLKLDERQRWIAEVKFLKAYYNYLLLRMYGPIPIVDKNLNLDATVEDVRIKRLPFDQCVDYISNLLDEAVPNLPVIITDRTNELGRITKPIALAIKARLLLTAASPLFNGNSDYAGFRDKDGVALFNTTYDANKWVKAADAAQAAITAAEGAGFRLYKFPGSQFKLSDTTTLQLTIRGALTERVAQNQEHVWANSNSLTGFLQQVAMPRLMKGSDPIPVGVARQQLAPPIKIAEMFYSKNGVPINEDKTLDFTNRYSLRKAVKAERFYIKEGYTTARLNFDREPRFYADLAFDGATWYKYDSPSGSDENTFTVEAKSTQLAGANNFGWYNETGYFIKKVVDWNMTQSSSGATYRNYAWPEIRLADLYLMYAEAKNETLSSPSSEVYEYINRVRLRAGLQSIESSWTNYSTNPSKYSTKDGMRSIIQQERLIEMAFEGSRFWDIRRWKRATEMFNQPITAWSVDQPDEQSYYRVRTVLNQNFIAPRDYLWPIRSYDLTVNPKLVQNPGW